jgi:hypothetical protein
MVIRFCAGSNHEIIKHVSHPCSAFFGNGHSHGFIKAATIPLRSP